jgi:hypothetical protein
MSVTTPDTMRACGNGRFDVLEVLGHIYKADYRMRLIYAQIKGSCALMGQRKPGSHPEAVPGAAELVGLSVV